jgi:phosphoribosylglycinamide formyltransferase-1
MMRLVVLISGQGSNLQAILDACHKGELAATVVAVVSDRAEALGLKRAEKLDIPTMVKPRLPSQDIQIYEQDLAESISIYRPDWIVLAGWMRLLTRVFLDRFPQRVINLHPALPNTFPGLHAIERAFNAFQRGEIQETGVMVHLVPDEGVDCGPVLGQATVPIMKEHTLETLTAQIHETEHNLLVNTLIQLGRDKI